MHAISVVNLLTTLNLTEVTYAKMHTLTAIMIAAPIASKAPSLKLFKESRAIVVRNWNSAQHQEFIIVIILQFALYAEEI